VVRRDWERVDLDLLAAVARLRPDYHIVMVGPVVRIDQSLLPRAPNLHYLGKKDYEHLPAYLAGWDVAIMPFALNRATDFISPTKTLEYLAAAKPVVSTAVHDVVHPYADEGLVAIGDDPKSFATHVDAALVGTAPVPVHAIDALLDATSWDATWAAMEPLIDDVATQQPPHGSMA
jgi:glycosyltransferase involved in cell wall biosynthesis